MLESKIRLIQPSGTIYYAESVASSIRKSKSDFKLNKYLKDRLILCDSLGIKISKADMRFFRRHIKRGFQQQLPDALFKDSKRLQNDSLSKQIHLLNKLLLDSIVKLPAQMRPKRKYLNWQFYFSAPIYNRQRSLVLIFFMYYYNSAGESQLYILKPGSTQMNTACRFGGGVW